MLDKKPKLSQIINCILGTEALAVVAIVAVAAAAAHSPAAAAQVTAV